MTRLAGKAAIVTGASKGIGAGIARALARAGARVIVNYATDADAAAKVCRLIAADGGQAIAIAADVADRNAITALFDRAMLAFGGIDILVNNAGVYSHQALAELTEAEIDRLFATNVKGLLLASQAAADRFPPAGGSIINIGSVSSTATPPGAAAYVGAKAATNAITGSLARELGPRNIRVNCVLPGFTATDGARAAGFLGGDLEAYAIAHTPLGRVGLPADIADVVTFLASDEARWITGALLPVSGGFG